MVRVVLAGSNGREFTGGEHEFEVGADTVRRMLLELEARYPGFGEFVEKRMAIAIDGEIHQDAWGAELRPGSEVVLIPKIGGG
jgi:molybdopterin converting factor small subunit